MICKISFLLINGEYLEKQLYIGMFTFCNHFQNEIVKCINQVEHLLKRCSTDAIFSNDTGRLNKQMNLDCKRT